LPNLLKTLHFNLSQSHFASIFFFIWSITLFSLWICHACELFKIWVFMAWWFCHLGLPRWVKGRPNWLAYMWNPCSLSKCRWNNQWFYTPHLDLSCTQSASSIACFGESFPWSPSWIANLALIKITSCYKMDVNIAQKNENIHYTQWKYYN
jgi:hypothetical protein